MRFSIGFARSIERLKFTVARERRGQFPPILEAFNHNHSKAVLGASKTTAVTNREALRPCGQPRLPARHRNCRDGPLDNSLRETIGCLLCPVRTPIEQTVYVQVSL